MLHRIFAGIVLIALIWAITLSAQKVVDINSAPEADIAAVGIDKVVAKKIVEGRPYTNKRELVTRELMTMQEYDKIKDLIIARRPPKK
jgi:DNA uptake protein ComE-like DNA-binding protein